MSHDSGYVKDYPAYCLDHQFRMFYALKYIMIKRKFNPICRIRLNNRLNINVDMLINIADLEVAHLSSHEGSTKLRHFWFQYQVRHLSVWTMIELFMASLTASKLSRQFYSLKSRRVRASDFSSNLKTSGSVTIYS